MQRDPLGYVDGINTYQALRSNPFRHLDPFGTSTKQCKEEAGKQYKAARKLLIGAYLLAPKQRRKTLGTAWQEINMSTWMYHCGCENECCSEHYLTWIDRADDVADAIRSLKHLPFLGTPIVPKPSSPTGPPNPPGPAGQAMSETRAEITKAGAAMAKRIGDLAYDGLINCIGKGEGLNDPLLGPDFRSTVFDHEKPAPFHELFEFNRDKLRTSWHKKWKQSGYLDDDIEDMTGTERRLRRAKMMDEVMPASVSQKLPDFRCK